MSHSSPDEQNTLNETTIENCRLKDAEETAFQIVNDAIESASCIVEEEKKAKVKEICEEITERSEKDNIQWSSCRGFTPEVGLKDIEAFIETWDRKSSWLHFVDFIEQEDYEYDVRYKFRVRWSQPTRRRPIPRAIAAVYFTIKVSKVKPKQLPVEVFYVFEGSQLVHRPGKSMFREKWLRDIVTDKLTVIAEVDF